MPKFNSRRGGGRKSRLLDATSDVDMADVVLPRAERRSRKRDKKFGPRTKHEDVRRSRFDRLLKDSSISQLSPTSSRNDRGTRMRSHASSAQLSDGDSSFNRHSAVMLRSRPASTRSSHSGGAAVPWCEPCMHLNRQLRDYLFELFDTGRRAIDEWTCVTGVSVDHMDYERASTVAIQESVERSSQICQSCTTSPSLGDNNYLGRLGSVQDRGVPGIASLESTPEPTSSMDRGLGSQRPDYGEPPTQAPLHARWADENVGPWQQPHNYLASQQQQQPQTPVNATSPLADPIFPLREPRSPETPFQHFHTEQGDLPSRGVILPPLDPRWAQGASGDETTPGGRRVLPSLDDIGVIYQAMDYHARGRATEGPVRYSAPSEEMAVGESL